MYKYPIYRTGIGQDSHRFEEKDLSKPFIFGGIVFEGVVGFSADSDGDVLLHSICNAISSLTGIPILGGLAIDLCKSGIKDSKVYLQKALETLVEKKQKIVHLAISIEGKKPRFQDKIENIKKSISSLMNIEEKQIGITATSGDGLGDFGKGLGVQCFCILSTMEIME